MAILSKESLLRASDLVEREIELPTLGGSVRVRSLPAAYSNQAQSDAVELVTDARGGQTAKIDQVKLEALQVLHGLIDPKFDSIEEVNLFAQRCGPAWHKIVSTIAEISGIDRESAEKTKATFPAGGSGAGGSDVANGASARSGRPDLPVRTGARTADARG